MLVHRHAEKALIALTQKMPVPASVVIERLKNEPAPAGDVAIVVCQMTMGHGRPFEGTNGDTVVVISRGGVAITAMLRRSWNQSFAADVLRVDEVVRWDQWYGRKVNIERQESLAKSGLQGVG